MYVYVLYPSNDGTEFGGSIYQKVNDKLETAVNLAWTAGSNSTRFGIAAKYQLDSSASISVRAALLVVLFISLTAVLIFRLVLQD